MEITTSNKIVMRLYRNSGTMLLNPTGVAYLKLPKFIQFLEKENFTKIIIRACDINDTDSIPIVGKNYSYSKGGLAIKSNTFIFKLWEANKWDKHTHYLVPGIIDISKTDTILFDFSKAEKIDEKTAI
jgi:hypothetical protein